MRVYKHRTSHYTYLMKHRYATFFLLPGTCSFFANGLPHACVPFCKCGVLVCLFVCFTCVPKEHKMEEKTQLLFYPHSLWHCLDWDGLQGWRPGDACQFLQGARARPTQAVLSAQRGDTSRPLVRACSGVGGEGCRPLHLSHLHCSSRHSECVYMCTCVHTTT